MVATSELVLYLGGPATEKGSLATTRLPLSVWKMKTRLLSPSFFSYEEIELAPGHSVTTF